MSSWPPGRTFSRLATFVMETGRDASLTRAGHCPWAASRWWTGDSWRDPGETVGACPLLSVVTRVCSYFFLMIWCNFLGSYGKNTAVGEEYFQVQLILEYILTRVVDHCKIINHNWVRWRVCGSFLLIPTIRNCTLLSSHMDCKCVHKSRNISRLSVWVRVLRCPGPGLAKFQGIGKVIEITTLILSLFCWVWQSGIPCKWES